MRLFGRLLLLLVTLGVVGNCSPPPNPPKPPPKVKNRILEAKRFLGTFEGDRARNLFLSVNKDWQAYYKTNNCDATYGVILADSQRAVKSLNGLLLRLASTGFSGAPGQAPTFTKAQVGRHLAEFGQSAEAEKQDYGVLIENGWAQFQPILEEIGDYAGAVTNIPNCTFSIGVGDEPYDQTRYKDNPYKFVINLGDSTDPIIQLIFQERFDGAEARAIQTIVTSVLAIMNFVIAHDYTMSIDDYKILYQLGLPSYCARENVFKCLDQLEDSTDHPPVNLMDWAFLFQDNPGLLAKSNAKVVLDEKKNLTETRWKYRMDNVDNYSAAGMYSMRSFFAALVARNVILSSQSASDEKLNQYAFIYKDNNENGKIDTFDEIGIKITRVVMSCKFPAGLLGMTDDEKTECDKAYDKIETGINAALPLIQSLKPDEASIEALQTFFERLYGNMYAVDHPKVTHERIPFNTFDPVIENFTLGLLIDSPTPDFMEFDITAFFTNPKPIREFLPYWEYRIDATFPTASRFLVDSDSYNYAPPFDWPNDVTPPALITMPLFNFDDRYSQGGYYPATVQERSVLTGTYDGGVLGTITGIGSPADCLNAYNLFSTFSVPNSSGSGSSDETINWPVMTFAMQDPKYNDMVYIDLDAWATTFGPEGNGGTTFTGWSGVTVCPNPAGFAPGTTYSDTRAMWLYLDFLFDHFSFTGLFSTLGLAP